MNLYTVVFQSVEIGRIGRQIVFHHLDACFGAAFDSPGGEEFGGAAGTVWRIVFICKFYPVFVEFGSLGKKRDRKKKYQQSDSEHAASKF